MPRKIYAAFLPLFAVVAFASMTGAAQAEPHWYKCEHLGGATHKFKDSSCSEATTTGEYERVQLPFTSPVTKTRVKTFGVLTLTAPAASLVIKCFVDDHGKVWNKTLGTPGLDEIQVFENYECESVPTTTCKKTLEVVSEGLPWPSELTEAVKGTVRDKIGTAAIPIKVRVKCAEPATNLLFTGELSPKVVNGTQANGGVSFAEFDAESGHLTNTEVGEGKITGKDFVIGVENAENIDVLNP